MAESAIEKIMRLKREREASAVGGADTAVKAPESQTPTPMEVLQASEPAEPEPVTPLSAMERLRQLKAGTSESQEEKENVKPNRIPNLPVDHRPTDDIHAGNAQVKEEVAQVQKVLKEAKTHPIAMEMAELEAALDAEVPGFVNILSAIHKKLRLDPECVTLLDDEEIGVIVAGLEKHTNVTIVSPNAVKAAKKAAKVPVSASDL